jgi:hypothetical protein
MFADFVQQPLCAENVDVHVERRIVERRSDACHCSQVHDHVKLAIGKNCVERIETSDIALNQMEVLVALMRGDIRSLSRRRIERVEVVQHRYVVAALEKPICQMASDESCAAGY